MNRRNRFSNIKFNMNSSEVHQKRRIVANFYLKFYIHKFQVVPIISTHFHIPMSRPGSIGTLPFANQSNNGKYAPYIVGATLSLSW